MKSAMVLICVVAITALRPSPSCAQHLSDSPVPLPLVAMLQGTNAVACLSHNVQRTGASLRETSFNPHPNPTDLTAMNDSVNSRGRGFMLEQNYPNPFNPGTVIRFSIPEDALVSIRLYNLLGVELMVLLNEHRRAGSHSITVDGRKLATGSYLYALELPGRRLVRMMTVVR
ncbi:MAG: T9SS type A sorting domain-containing protein [Bacteroidia bacterium]|nr:T9SS type A sorting domain-containing protein [Bacteroidia bacterium]